MAKKTINLGTGELTGDGESIRSAFDKINDNFDELYTQDGNDVVLSSINASLIPDTDVAYDLGSATKRFRDLYLSGSTIDLGGTTLSVVGGELQLGGVKVPTTADVAASIASAVSAPTGDLTGSVFADDSTLMVDAINQTMFAETITTLAVFGNPTLSLNADSIAVDAQNGNLNLQTTDTIVNTFVNGWEVNGINGASMVLNDDGVTSSELSVNIDVVDFGTGNTVDLQGNSVLFDGATVQNFAPGAIYAKDGQYLYITSIHSGGTATNAAFTYDTNVSGNVKQTFYGTTQFGNNGEAPVVDFTGATVTGLTLDGDVTGSVFADDSTLLVDGVNGRLVGPLATENISHPANDGLGLRLNSTDQSTLLVAKQSFDRTFDEDFSGYTLSILNSPNRVRVTFDTNNGLYLRGLLARWDNLYERISFGDPIFFEYDYSNIRLSLEPDTYDIVTNVVNVIFVSDNVYDIEIDQDPITVLFDAGAEAGELSQIALRYDYNNTMGFDIENNRYGIAVDHDDIDLRAGRDIDLYAVDDFRLRAGSNFDLNLNRTDDQSASAGIDINLISNNDALPEDRKTWTFRFDGGLRFPDGEVQTTAYPGPQTTFDGDVTGSVFADDSTVLVDGVAGKLVGPYDNGVVSINPTNVTTYDIFVQQDANTHDLYVSEKIRGGQTGSIKNVAIASFAPSTSVGASGDLEGMVAFDGTYMYYCTANYDGSTNIWRRVAWSGDTW